MRTTRPRRPASLHVGFGLLALQAMAAPFMFVQATRPVAQPAWATGLYLATDLAAAVALLILRFGVHSGARAARFAPAVLVVPGWAALAVTSPLQHDNLAAAGMFALWSLAIAFASAAPFLTRAGEAIFAGGRTAAEPLAALRPGA